MTRPAQAKQSANRQEPVMPNNAIVCRRVLDRHKIQNLSLAAATGISESTISRMLNGHINISLEVLRALWQMTNDADLVNIAFGDPNAVLISMSDESPHDQTFYKHRALGSAASIVNALIGHGPQITKHAMRRLIDQNITDLHLFRNSMSTPTQHPSVGSVLDEVA